jgi:misacylated tRNA(Ala) deacylase
MTQDIFRQNAYQTECTATVTAITPQGIVLDRTVFYPLGGGQAGDTGWLVLSDGSQIDITDTRKGKAEDGSFNGEIVHLCLSHMLEQLSNSDQLAMPRLAVGDTVTARIDWARRLRMMRFHTASHLLCHIVPKLVNGCSITPDYARIDFNMTEALDKEALSAAMATLVAAAHPVTVGAITDDELDANPALVKSMSVQPPRGSGQIRTIQIGAATASTTTDATPIGQAPLGADQAITLIDLQPCGGTHVANTAEIGAVIVTKIEKKSAMTRRVVLGFAP